MKRNEVILMILEHIHGTIKPVTLKDFSKKEINFANELLTKLTHIGMLPPRYYYIDKYRGEVYRNDWEPEAN